MATTKETGIGTDPETVELTQLNKVDKNELKQLLQQRLSECGWRKDVEQRIRNTLQQRGVTNVSYDQLSAEIMPQARAAVPAAVRQELAKRVSESLAK
ncbi:enhancer of yellow 2b transcription factor-like [Drosophila busckii]|uniref:enhancer of yellow 2b transcription factor-like n=1 Tax=Drosophila busckii TaxID=30019 RepID=UPI00083F365B|nr:enhancer of yellow 2b transcription factor-like [Drosophila busckii]